MISLLSVVKSRRVFNMKNRVYVGGLTTQVTKEALYEEFNFLFGRIVDIQILYHRVRILEDVGYTIYYQSFDTAK